MKRRLAHRQRIPNGLGHLYGIAVSADMHVERQRFSAQQVIVNRGDFHPAFDQLGHDRVDFALEQHKVTHRHRHVPHRLEGDPAAERKGRPDRHAVERDLKVRAGKTPAMNRAADGSRSAKNPVDLGPVDALRIGSHNRRQHGAAGRENPDYVLHDSPPWMAVAPVFGFGFKPLIH